MEAKSISDVTLKFICPDKANLIEPKDNIPVFKTQIALISGDLHPELSLSSNYRTDEPAQQEFLGLSTSGAILITLAALLFVGLSYRLFNQFRYERQCSDEVTEEWRQLVRLQEKILNARTMQLRRLIQEQ